MPPARKRPQAKSAEGTFDRVPPQAVEAERAVLGAVLLDGEAMNKVLDILTESSFYREAHRKIYAAMVSLYERSEAIDVITVVDEMSRLGTLESAGGRLYLSSLLDEVATSANVSYHAGLVLEKALLRRMIHAGTEIVQRAYEGVEDVKALLDRAEQSIFDISESQVTSGFLPIRAVVKPVYDEAKAMAEGGRSHLGVQSGFPDLDALLSGFQKGDLIIVASRPSMGKTSFCLNIAQNVALDSKLPVAIFSLEMSRENLVQRLLCSEARVDSHALRTGYVPQRDWPNLTTAASLLSTAPIFIDDSASLTVLEMRSRARRLHKEASLALLIVDYLQLIRASEAAENRQQEISLISRSLKALAKELNLPVVALSQLSRAVETRTGAHRPVLSDLRESGAIEQDADVVLFLYRPEVYEKIPENEGKAEVIIGKQRNGPLGTVDLTFLKSFTRFESLSAREAVETPVGGGGEEYGEAGEA
ncbi:MAG: replicative DNA helicase [Candidatus Eisenbacteria bacterium]|nr:replicative DNA helicase [Candidatus Eisenbacteria bacterium]